MPQLAEEKPVKNYLSTFSRIEKQVGGRMWLDEMRKSAMDHFAAVGFPTGREEEWRHTNVSPIAKIEFRPAPNVELHGDDIAAYSFGRDASAELVFVNGHYSPKLSVIRSLPKGVTVSSLAGAFDTHGDLVRQHLSKHADITVNPFVALNTGFVREGAFVHIPRNFTVEKPIHVLFVTTPGNEASIVHPRMLVIAEDNSEATIVSSFFGTGGQDGGVYFDNAVAEIVCGNDSRVDHNKIQMDSAQAYHVSTTQAKLGRGAKFVSYATTLGGKLTRNDLNIVLAGEGADATLNGLVILNKDQHCDNHTLLDNAAPNCPSYELYKHVLADKSSAVFKGKILVRQIAQKTDSKQTSKSLLLSDDATMNSQPALEIYADDVKCTHGSTIGPVDEDMVFYLRSRGVSLEAARHLLTYAFAADVTRRMKVEAVRARIENYLAAQHGLPQDLRITDLGAHDEAVL